MISPKNLNKKGIFSNDMIILKFATFLLLFYSFQALDAQAFITTWKTDNPGSSANNQITITTAAGSTYNYNVEWVDVTNPSITGTVGTITGTTIIPFPTPGTYQVSISGDFPRIYFAISGDAEKLLSVDQWGDTQWVSMRSAFGNCTNLTIQATDTPDLSLVTDMSWMFSNATSFNQSIDHWDVSNATNMNRMFWNATSFDQPLESWDVSNVISIFQMFEGATSFNQPLSNWDVSGAGNMAAMFKRASSFNQDISGWDVSNVTVLMEMFDNATSFNQDISGWNVSNVEYLSGVFNGASSFDQNLGAWDIRIPTDLTNLFSGSGLSSTNYDSTLIGWSNNANIPQNVTIGAYGLQYCNDLGRNKLINDANWTITGDSKLCAHTFVTTWKTDNPGTSATNQITIPTTGTGYNYTVEWVDTSNPSFSGTEGPFTGTATITFPSVGTYRLSISGDFPRIFFNGGGDKDKILSVDQWGDITWSSMANAFDGCSNLSIPATGAPDLTLVSDLSNMFKNASSFNDPINHWSVSNVTNMSGVFYLATNFNQPIGIWDTRNVTNMNNLFSSADSFNQDIGNWDVSNVTDMSNMFANNDSFDRDISLWNVGSVMNMKSMFSSTKVFNQDIGAWNVSNVTDMSFMFSGADLFNQDISSWDVAGVNNMRSIFSGADVFNQPLGTWNIGLVTDLTDAFDNTFSFSANTYNETLTGWSNLPSLQPNITLGVSGLFYCDEVARNSLINTYGWTFDGDQKNCASTVPFITTWNTNNPGATSFNQIKIQTTGGGYDYSVTWEDVSNPSQTGTAGPFTGDAIINFPWPGTYRVSISGVFPQFHIGHSGDEEKLLSVDQWGDQRWQSFSFQNCTNLRILATDAPDMTQMNSMRYMFKGASAFNDPIDHWDVSTITTMEGTFREATSFNQPLGTWDVSDVTNMSQLFNSATQFNQDIGGWDVSSVVNMGAMFAGATSFDQPIANWNTGVVTSMRSMFSGASAFNRPLETWDVSSVTNMTSMFSSASSFNQSISSWNVSSVISMRNMFSNASSFNQPLNNWDVSNVTDTRGMFRSASLFNQDISAWNISNVSTMSDMFFYASSFNQPLNSWDVSNVSDMNRIFRDASSFDQSLGGWDVGNVTDFADALSGTAISLSNYDSTLMGWSSLPSLQPNVVLGASGLSYCAIAARDILSNAYGWQIGGEYDSDCRRHFITTWKTDNPGSFNNRITITTTSTGYNYHVEWVNIADTTLTGRVGPFTSDATIIFPEIGSYQVSIVGSFPRIDFSSSVDVEKLLSVDQWGDAKWISMRSAFANCSNLTIQASDAPDLSMVTDMSWMFANATSFNQSIDHWDVSNVTSMNRMFWNATSFDQPLESWNINNVDFMSQMFEGATSFNQSLSNWDVSGAANMAAMFKRASSFNQDISGWDVSNVTVLMEMFDNATSFNQDISGWNVSNVEYLSAVFNGASSFNQDLSSWDISGVTDLTNAFSNCGLSQYNYDATLEGWAGLPSLQSDVTLGANTLTYCDETSRNHLITTYNWTISGDALATDCSVNELPNTIWSGSTSSLTLNTGGKVGIGTTTPQYDLDVNGAINTKDLLIGGAPYVEHWTKTGENLTFTGGKVGIGTTSPDELLTVNGRLHAERVKVELDVPGPDYVFDSSYKLPTLSEVATYIQENKHLPYLPSAKEMEAGGIDAGTQQMQLLRTLEEMIIHQITFEKKIDQLEERNKALKKQIQQLKTDKP